MNKVILSTAIAVCTLAGPFASAAPLGEVKELMSKPLPDLPGKEGLVVTVLTAGQVVHSLESEPLCTRSSQSV